jgi:hypothetical protein
VLKLTNRDAEAANVGTTEQPRRLLGQILVEMDLISEDQLDEALGAQRETGELLGEVLIARGFVTRVAIQDALALQRSLLVEPEPGLGGGLRAREVGERASAISRPMGSWVAQGRIR